LGEFPGGGWVNYWGGGANCAGLEEKR
jgi:hypothetical protein